MTPYSADSVSPIEMPVRDGGRSACRDVAQSSHRFADHAEARPLAVGTGLAVTEMRTITSRVAAASAS